MFRFRFTLRFALVAVAFIAAAISVVEWRRTNQRLAVRHIKSNDGLVARFDEWIVLGNSGKIERELPSVACSKQTNWVFNEPVREVLVNAMDYDDAMRFAIERLPTIERIHVLGDDDRGDATALIQRQFPNAQVLNIDQLMRETIR